MLDAIHQDIEIYVVALSLIGCFTLLCNRIGKVSSRYNVARRLLHFVSVLTCSEAIAQVENLDLLGWMFLLMSGILFFVAKYKFLSISQGESIGIALFPLAFSILIYLGVDTIYIVASGYLLAIADPLAGMLGTMYGGRSTWSPLAESKSLIGSLAFILIGLPIVIFFQNYFLDTSYFLLLLLLLVWYSAAEMFSWRGSDNLSVILFCGLTLSAANLNRIDEVAGWIAIITVAFVAYPLLKGKVLDAAAIVAAGVLASVISACCGLEYLVFPGFFLLLGGMMSKVGSASKPYSSDKEGRTAVQVFANSLPAIVCSLLYAYDHSGLWLTLLAVTFSVALADTLSSEGGRIFGTKTIDILTFRSIEKGLSGGVSASGTLLGLIGGMIISVVGTVTFQWDIYVSIFVVCTGFAGMIIDSILGSAVQGKVQTADSWSEEDVEVADKGFASIDNNLVNLLSISITVVLAYFVYPFFIN